MPMLKEGWAEALEPGIRKWFYLGYNRRPSLIPTFFNMPPSQKDSEHHHGAGNVGVDAWDHFKKTKDPATVDNDAGYKKTFTHETYMVEYPVEVEMMEDNLYSDVLRPVQKLGDSARKKRERDAASVFNNAFSGSFVGADAVALCSDSHPHSPTKSGTTQDNNFALTLNPTNVETIRQAMIAWTDDVGEPADIIPNLLLVPVALENEARIITETMNKVGSMDNDINPQEGRFSYLVWNRLTDSNAWFMIDTMAMKDMLFWYDRVPLSIELDRVEKRAFAFYNARMRYSFGWDDWRWIAGSNPS